MTAHSTYKCSNTNDPTEETLNQCASPHPSDVFSGFQNGLPYFDPAEYETYMRVFNKLIPLDTDERGIPYMDHRATVWNRATELRTVFRLEDPLDDPFVD